MKTIKITEPVFNRLTIVCVGSFSDFSKWHIKRYGVEPDTVDVPAGFSCRMERLSDKLSEQIVWIPSFSGKTKELKLISHELNHITFFIMSHLGINDGLPNEVHCYYHDFLLGEFLKKIKK